MELSGKSIVVTGGSDGIGKHICLKLAAQQCRLAIMGRSEERLRDVADRCMQLGAEAALTYAGDIRDHSQLERTIGQITTDLDGVDVLINNAGIWHKTGTLDQIDAQVVDDTVSTNLTALMQTTRLLIETLRSREEAAIVNVVSKSGVIAQAGESVYAATKFGVHGFTEVLKADESDSSVRVAGIYQSGTNTQMFEKVDQDVPNHIFTEPEDLADVVVFMLTRPPKLWIDDIRIGF